MRASAAPVPEWDLLRADFHGFLSALIRGTFGTPADVAGQVRYFATHLESWAGHFFIDLEGAQTSVFHAPLGRIGRIFLEIEREAFRMDA